jgi:N-acetylglutamate synthase-like GNAT family acetyltransferase
LTANYFIKEKYALNTEEIDDLRNLIIDAFDYHSWIPEEQIDSIVTFFIYDIVISSNYYTVVYDKDERLIGLITAQIFKNGKLSDHIRLRQDYFHMLKKSISTKQVAFSQYIESMERDEQNLLEHGVEYPANLNFFAIKTDWQKVGIGKELYSLFIGYLKKININKFYILSDTGSNYKFYEKNNALKVKEWLHSWDLEDEENTDTFFIYEQSIE